jgi:DNA-binding Lrp family transcriptional regulator
VFFGHDGKIFYVPRQRIVEEDLMPSAFLLINTELGSEIEVLKNLRTLDGVEEAFNVYGTYDIIARVKADTMEKLKEIITWKIRRLDKVRATLTLMSVEESK